jgi:cytochrome c oxidase assembly factor CtaG
MVPMAAIAIWLLAAGAPLYAPYEAALGPGAALDDQRLAGLIMLLAGIRALALALAPLFPDPLEPLLLSFL